MPNPTNKMKTPAPSVSIPDSLPRLGCAVLVRFHGPTNTRPARYSATIKDGKHKAKAFVSMSYQDDEQDKLSAVSAALVKWAGTFPEWATPSSFTLQGKGWTEGADLYFFHCSR